MSNVKVITGNIFTTSCQTLVNTVNCVGVMGAGIAFECRLRYPEMFGQFQALCRERKIDVGVLWLYKASDRWILNFPTKRDWRHPSKEEYLHAGLRKFVETYKEVGVISIAFPVLGAQHGGLEVGRAIEIMQSHLVNCSIPVEIFRHDPAAADDLFDKFRNRLRAMPDGDLKVATRVTVNRIRAIRDALERQEIHQMSQLARVKGIGVKTLERVFLFVRGDLGAQERAEQRTLAF